MGLLTNIVQRANTQRPASTERSRSGGGLAFGGASAFTQAAEAYASSGWLFSIISRITNGVARVDWQELVPSKDATPVTRAAVRRMHLPGGAGKAQAQALSAPVLRAMALSGQMEPAKTMSPAFALWSNPNPFFSQHELVEVIQQHLELRGEGWIVVVRGKGGDPIELWPVRPDKMTPVQSREDFVSGYIYKNGNESIPLEPDDVIFLRVPSPTDMYRGMGPVQSVLSDLDSDRYAAQWNRNFFTNGAEPGGIIEVQEGLSDAGWERMQNQWRSEHQGVNQAHRVAILEKSKWVNRQYSHTDMAFIDGRKWSRDIFLGAFGLSGAMIGVTETSNRSSAEAGEVMFSRWTIVPRCDRIKMALNSRLQTMFKGGPTDSVITYVDPTPEDRALRVSVSTATYKSGLVTRNEGRAELGLPPTEDGGDEFFVPPPPPGSAPPGDGAPEGGGTSPEGPEPGDEKQALEDLTEDNPVSGNPATARKARVIKGPPSKWPKALRVAEEQISTLWERRLEQRASAAISLLQDRWVADFEQGRIADGNSPLLTAMLNGVALIKTAEQDGEDYNPLYDYTLTAHVALGRSLGIKPGQSIANMPITKHRALALKDSVSGATQERDERGRFGAGGDGASAGGRDWATGLFGKDSIQSARDGAKTYVEAHRAALGLNQDTKIDYLNVVANRERASAIAQAYTDLPQFDEKAIPSYKALAAEVEAQFNYMTKELGVKVEFVANDPYKTSKEMFADASKGTLNVLATASTGSHPYFTDAQNDKFRAVHDFFGHAATGRGFGQDGEESAWVHHSQMFSDAARGALTTETRGQNSWFNVKKDGFADQKIALLPPEYWAVPKVFAKILGARERKDSVSGATQERDEGGRFAGGDSGDGEAPAGYSNGPSGAEKQYVQGVRLSIVASKLADEDRRIIGDKISDQLSRWSPEVRADLNVIIVNNESRVGRTMVAGTNVRHDGKSDIVLGDLTYLTNKGDDLSSDRTFHHEMGHVYAARLVLADGQVREVGNPREFDKATTKYLTKNFGKEAVAEMNAARRQAAGNPTQEAFAEAVGMYAATGKTAGPAVREALERLGVTKAVRAVDVAKSGLSQKFNANHDEATGRFTENDGGQQDDNFAKDVASRIEQGQDPVIPGSKLPDLLRGMAALTGQNPDITELKIDGTRLMGADGLGIARVDMPQIPAEERERFLSDIAKDGISVNKERVDPKGLQPIQKEVSGQRAGAIFNKFEKTGVPDNERILISKDNYIVDGHHTWAAAVGLSFADPKMDLPVYRLSVNARESLSVSLEWAKANGYEGQAIDAPAKKALDALIAMVESLPTA